MPRIDQETVNKILDTADIVDVVSDFVKLRRSGANFKGLCPFHNERTPSFSVNRARNICKCFSCGKGGSPVNFIMEHEQLSYQEALRYLARKYNIEIVEKELSDQEREAMNTREAMLAVNEFALTHFKKNLLESDEGRDTALAYLRHRGISDAMIARFHLGYAIDKSRELIDAAKSSGFNTKYLVDTGLAIERDDKSLYDRFRSRVIFPVHSISGRVIAFGGRTMRSDKTIAKYVNSPESSIYHKNLELYGLYQAKSAIAKKDKCILVEGYLDVISMHQAGVENVVASSGTSLTEGQIRALRRFSNNVTLIYDADAAGIKASLRGINMLLGEGLNVKVLSLPPGDDPDSFAQSHSSTEVEAYLADHEVDIIAFMADMLLRDVPDNDPTAKAKAINGILYSVAFVDDPVTTQEYIAQCSRRLSVPEQVLAAQLRVLRTRRLEEAAKDAARRQARESVAPQTETNTTVATDASEEQPVVPEAPLLNLDTNSLRPYEEMLMRYIVRYGLMYIMDIARSDGSFAPGTVFDLIDGELGIDGYSMTYPPFKRTYEAVKELRYGSWQTDRTIFMRTLEDECSARMAEAYDEIRQKAENIAQIESMEQRAHDDIEKYRLARINEFDAKYCQDHLANSPDDVVRNTANALIIERYTLSRIYTKQENIESEESQLPELVPRAIYELQNAILSARLRDLSTELATLDASHIDRAQEIIMKIAELQNMQRELVKVLGERIILPKR